MISPSPTQPSSLQQQQQLYQRLSYHRPTPYHIARAILIGWQLSEDAAAVSTGKDPDLVRYGRHIKVFLQQTHNDRNTIIDDEDDDGDHETTTIRRRKSRLYEGPNLQDFCTQLYRSLLPSHDDDNDTIAARLVTKFTIWCQIVTQSLDTFMDFMSTISSSSSLLPQQQADRSSPNGILVRALALGYDMLSFDQVTRLYEAFSEDLQCVNLTAIMATPSSRAIPSSSSPPPHPATTPTTAWIRSSEQVDQTLRQYCYHPNSSDYHDTNMNLGDDVYPQLPAAHFLKFRTALAQHERVEAHTTLYEFIDRTLIASSRCPYPEDTTTAAADILQYASILQAMLCHHSHHQIDHMNQAIEEAIRVIQQQPPPSSNASGGTSSTATLRMTSTLFVMAWCAVAQWDSIAPIPTTIGILQRCMDTCRSIFGAPPNPPSNGGNSSVSSSSPPSIPLMMGIHLWHAALTHSWISHDRAISFYTVDPGTKTASTTLTNTALTPQRPLYDRPIHTIHLDNPDLMTNVLARQKMVAAQIYYANNEITLSLSTLMEILHYYYYDNDENDESLTSRRHHASRRRRRSSNCPDLIRMVIRNVSLIASTTGSTRMADLHWMRCPPRTTTFTSTPESSGCIYQKAIVTYISLCDQYSISITKNRNSILHEVRMDLLFLFHEWAVRRHEFDHANAILTRLESYDRTSAASSNGNDNNMLLYHKILSLSRQKQYGAVITMLTTKIPKYKARQQHRESAWTLLQLSRMYIESNRSRPTAPFIDALQPVLECLSLSKQHKIYGLHNEALLVLAHIHLLMDQYHRTIPLLQMVLPALLANHHVSIQAEAFLILGQCRMRLAKNASGPSANQSPSGRRRQSKLLKTAIQEFHRSRELYEQCHDCRQLQEIHYLLAHSYHQLSQITIIGGNRSNLPTTNHSGHHECRDDAAAQYIQYTKRLSTTASKVPVAEFMAHLTTRDGVLMLASRPLLQ